MKSSNRSAICKAAKCRTALLNYVDPLARHTRSFMICPLPTSPATSLNATEGVWLGG